MTPKFIVSVGRGQSTSRSVTACVSAVEQMVGLEHGLGFAVGAGPLLVTLWFGQDSKRVTACSPNHCRFNLGVSEGVSTFRTSHKPARHEQATFRLLVVRCFRSEKGRPWEIHLGIAPEILLLIASESILAIKVRRADRPGWNRDGWCPESGQAPKPHLFCIAAVDCQCSQRVI